MISVTGIQEQKEKYWSTGRSFPGLGWAASVFLNGEAVSLAWAGPEPCEPHPLLHIDSFSVSKDGVVVDRQSKTYLSTCSIEPYRAYIDAFLDALERVEVPDEEWP